MMKVYHGRNYMNMAAGHARWPDDYKLVATVETNDPEKVFELTNHIDHDWTTNEGVKAEAGSHRSTSVGDIIVLADETVLRVASRGWEQITTGPAGGA